jgi:lysophospholipid acyltransferase (LPLAT)-like uncharacterized protein
VLKPSLRRLTTAPWFQTAIGVVGAEYLRLIWNTSSFALEPPDIYETVKPDLPVIVAMWHGQHFLMPFIKLKDHRAKTLISHHRDGAFNAVAAERLGVEVIRGSGTHGQDFDRKGGTSAFRQLLVALEEGYNVALTADVPKVARVCGHGIVKLASMSGRAIYPLAIATNPRRALDNWDRSVVHFPFSRGARVAGTPIRVPPNADSATLEAARHEVEASLNAATARAYEIVDGTSGSGAGG